MTPNETKSIGGKQLLKGAVFIFLLFEIALLYYQTRGDFANGILFFIEAQMNVLFLIIVIAFFAMFFLLGRQAGFNILFQKKNSNFIAIQYSVIAALIIISCFAFYMYSVELNTNPALGFRSSNLLLYSIRNFVVLLIPMLITWFWATNRIKLHK